MPVFYNKVSTLNTPKGIIQGVIDFLYQDGDSVWHLLDWKTEWMPVGEIERNVGEHIVQIAAYAQAVKAQLGVMPEVGLCFQSPLVKVCQFTAGEIDRTWDDVGAELA